MLGLPKSTEMSKQLPKKAVYAKFQMNTAAKEKIDADISRITIVNEITPAKINIPAGEEVGSFFVLLVALKKKDFDERTVATLSKLIPQNILFVLEFEGQSELAIYHTKLMQTDWKPTDSRTIELRGLNLDKVWENIVVDIGGVSIADGNTLDEQIAADERRQKIEKEITKLEKQARAEKQPKKKFSLEPKDGWIELYPLESQGVNTVWRWGKQKSQENLNVNIKAKPMRNGSYMIVEKYREGRMMARSVWWDKDTNTEKGTLLVKELMEGKVFDYPKTVEMLMKTIEMGTDSDEGAYVLDFFSGSGTTAHAVMQLNAKDGGNRKFIMVQLPERTDEKSEAYKAGYKNICEIGKERIRRAGRKIKEDSPLTTQDLDIGFRVLKCDTSNMKEVYYNPAEYEASLFPRLEDNIKEDRTPEDLLFQVMLDLGVQCGGQLSDCLFRQQCDRGNHQSHCQAEALLLRDA